MTIIEQIEQRKRFLKKGILNSLSNQEVITPLDLVEEMLDKLPEDIWKNPDLTWADICSKSGVFPMEIIYRLMKHLPIENETLRYEHIINNMVSVYVNAERNKWVVARTVYGDASEVHKVKLLEIDKIKEDMPKFDVVVGNPPYMDGLHLTFLEKSFNMSKEYVLFIEPASWLISEKEYKHATKEVKLKEKLKNNIESLDIYNPNLFFKDAKLSTPVGVILLKKSKKSPKFTSYDDMQNKKYVYNNIDEISKWGNEKEYISLKEKIKKIVLENESLLEFKNRDGKYYINFSEIRGNISYNNKDLFSSPDFFTMIPKDLEIENSSSKVFHIGFNIRTEAENFLSYIKTKFSRFCLSIYKIHNNHNRGELAIIPWLDFSQEWTDKTLYKYFNLTQEEINFIEQNIPDYY